MQNFLLVPLLLADFKRLIKECFKECFQEHLNANLLTPQQDLEQRLSQKETAEFLCVSEATIIEWKKKKLIPFHQLPGTSRVFFIKSELLDATRQNSNFIKPSKK